MGKRSVMQDLKWARLGPMVGRWVRLALAPDLIICGFLYHTKKDGYYIMVDPEKGPKIQIQPHIIANISLAD